MTIIERHQRKMMPARGPQTVALHGKKTRKLCMDHGAESRAATLREHKAETNSAEQRPERSKAASRAEKRATGSKRRRQESFRPAIWVLGVHAATAAKVQRPGPFIRTQERPLSGGTCWGTMLVWETPGDVSNNCRSRSRSLPWSSLTRLVLSHKRQRLQDGSTLFDVRCALPNDELRQEHGPRLLECAHPPLAACGRIRLSLSQPCGPLQIFKLPSTNQGRGHLFCCMETRC